MPLTELAIKGLKPQKTPYRKTDGGGLSLEITPAGGKLWRWRYYFNGKQQILSLGKYPAISLSEARKLRDEARQLATAGKHPAREKKARKLRNLYAGENTFEKVARRWLELKQKGLNEKYQKISRERMEQYVFPMIGALPITEITIPDIVRVIEKIGARGTIETARRVKQLISQTFRYASQRGICQHNPAADLRDILEPKTVKHHTCVPHSEAAALLQAMATYEGSKLTVGAMQLLALTFVRTGELIGAKWDEIDWNREEWLIRHAFTTLGMESLVSFTAQDNKRSRRVMEKIGMMHCPQEDFIHPMVPAGSRLAAHVLYRLKKT